MAEDPDQIEQNIESKRRDLGRHIQELETKVREETDWRTYVRRKPLSILSAAFGAGLLLAFALGGRR